MDFFVFPKWTNLARPTIAVLILVVPLYVGSVAWYGGSPQTTDVGYAPHQPVQYSHALHAGELGIDCRYCHTVEDTGFAAIPPTATCTNCHHRFATTARRFCHSKKVYRPECRWNGFAFTTFRITYTLTTVPT